jgi:hypothetical protein
MPRMDGIEAARQINGNCRGTLVLVISLCDPALVLNAVKETGAEGFVSTVSPVQAFVDWVNRFIDLAKRQTGLYAVVCHSSECPGGIYRKQLVFRNCANPECSAPFVFRKGRLFRFKQVLPQTATPNTHGVRHYWLCDRCAELYTLEYHADKATLKPRSVGFRKQK